MISTARFDNSVMSCVFINILLLIMPTMPKTPGIFFERIGNFTGSVDDFCMAVYVIEMVLKMYVFRKEYFKDPWDLLDFAIVCFSLFDMGIGLKESLERSSTSTEGASALKAAKLIRLLRATRMLRVLRTLKFIDRLQKYTETILRSIRSLGAILRLFGCLFCIFASIACSLYGQLLPKRFGNITLTSFTLIQMITLDDWFQILQEGSIPYQEPGTSGPTKESTSSINVSLFLFLVMYIFVMCFFIFNLLIAVLVDNFSLSIEENKVKESHEETHQQNMMTMIEQIESDHESDSELFEGLLPEEARPKKKIEMNEEEEFESFFGNLSKNDLVLREWYYRILPACERQLFYFNDQMSSYQKIIEEAITQSDEMFTAR